MRATAWAKLRASKTQSISLDISKIQKQSDFLNFSGKNYLGYEKPFKRSYFGYNKFIICTNLAFPRIQT